MVNLLFLLLSGFFFSFDGHTKDCPKIENLNKESPSQIKKICELYWKESNKSQKAEVVFLKKGCRKFEGNKLQNCYIVRICSDQSNTISFQSTPLLSSKGELNKYCLLKNPDSKVVLGSEDEYPRSPILARINCHKGKAKFITLESPDHQIVNCPLKKP